jgi:hypothetical protein
MDMNRRAWSTSGFVLAGLLVVPSLAVGQRCPVQMQLWYQAQMQQLLMSQSQARPSPSGMSSTTTTYNWPSPSTTVLRVGYPAVPRASSMSWKNSGYDLFSVSRRNEPRVPLSSPLLRRTDLFEDMVKVRVVHSSTVTPYREAGLNHLGRSPLENPFLSPWTVPVVRREVMRSESRVPVVKVDLFRHIKIPVLRSYHVSRDYFVWHDYTIMFGPKVPPGGWGPSGGLPRPHRYQAQTKQDKKTGGPGTTNDDMAPGRPNLQLQVRLDFTCGHCHLGGSSPGTSVVSQVPMLPGPSVLDLLRPQVPPSAVALPGLRPPASALRLPLVLSPLATLPPIPSTLVENNPLGPSPSTTDARTSGDPGPSALSLLETPEHPVIGSAVQPDPAPGPSLLAPPLPPLPGSALQEPAPARVAHSPVGQPNKGRDRPVASRPPPLPPLPQTAS